jgi:hypothetical protein
MDAQKIKQLLSEYFKDQPVLKAWFFGSFARGEENEASDVDILVVIDRSQPVGFKFFGMWNDLEKLLDRRVDFVTENSLADFARESVEHDKRLRNCKKTLSSPKFNTKNLLVSIMVAIFVASNN